MTRRACSGFEEDLALLAGSDLPEGEAAALRSHLQTCSGCHATFDALAGDLELLAGLDLLPRGLAETAEALGPTVVAELTRSEAMAGRQRPAVDAERRAARVSLVAALAAGLLVGAVLLLGPGTSPAPLIAGAGPSQADDYLPVRVSHGPVGVELSWEGDGREASSGHPYRVLASASPRDFTGTEALEVAGKRLVATAALPTRRFGDRGVTYFRVQ